MTGLWQTCRHVVPPRRHRSRALRSRYCVHRSLKVRAQGEEVQGRSAETGRSREVESAAQSQRWRRGKYKLNLATQNNIRSWRTWIGKAASSTPAIRTYPAKLHPARALSDASGRQKTRRGAQSHTRDTERRRRRMKTPAPETSVIEAGGAGGGVCLQHHSRPKDHKRAVRGRAT